MEGRGVWGVGLVGVRAGEGGPGGGGGPGEAPKGGAPNGWEGPNFAFFPSPRATMFFIFPPLLGVFSWNFAGVLKALGPPRMCVFGFLVLSCETLSREAEHTDRNVPPNISGKRLLRNSLRGI